MEWFHIIPGVNFINVFFARFFVQNFGAKPNTIEKSCRKDVHTKNMCVKCWWNWRQVYKSVFAAFLSGAYNFFWQKNIGVSWSKNNGEIGYGRCHSYRVFHGFELTKRDDYFWVFLNQGSFLRHLECYQKSDKTKPT
jgi:hypothetical protein